MEKRKMVFLRGVSTTLRFGRHDGASFLIIREMGKRRSRLPISPFLLLGFRHVEQAPQVRSRDISLIKSLFRRFEKPQSRLSPTI